MGAKRRLGGNGRPSLGADEDAKGKGGPSPAGPGSDGAKTTRRDAEARRWVGPLRAGASRARQLLKSLLSSHRGRLRATGTLPAVPKSGRLETFQRAIDGLDKHAAAFDLPVDFSNFRLRLEALLAVLLEVEDDRLVGEAARQLQDQLAAQLPRAEAIFVIPETMFGKMDLSSPGLARVRLACESGHYDIARAELLRHLTEKAVPEPLARWLRRRSSRVLDYAGLVEKGFLALGADGWTFFDRPVPWENVRDPKAHSHSEAAVLARAYVEAGEESHAKEAVAHILGWAARAGLPDGQDCDTGGPWGAACAAERILNWGTVFVALRGSKAFSPEVARAFLALVHESADIVCRCAAEGASDLAPQEKILVGASLLVTGTLFDEFRDAPSWREHGRLLAKLKTAGPAPMAPLSDPPPVAAQEMLPPGNGLNSPTFDAHERMFECLVAAALADPKDKDLSEAAVAALRFVATIVFPGGSFPGEPHSSPADATDRLAHLARAKSLLNAEGPRPGPGLDAFDDRGIFVMRTTVEKIPDSLVFLTKGAPAIHVASAGLEILSAPGTLLCRGVDMETAEGAGRSTVPRLMSLVRRPGPPCDYARATFGLAGGAVETREVLFVDREFWVIAVSTHAEANTECVFKLDIFAPECLASPDGRRLVVGEGEHAALVALAAPTDCGFRLDETPTGRTALAIAGGGDVRFVALVHPLRGVEAQALAVEPLSVGRADAAEPAKAAGLLVRLLGRQYAVGFPHGSEDVFDADSPFGGLPDVVQAIALARPDGGSWQTLFRLDRED